MCVYIGVCACVGVCVDIYIRSPKATLGAVPCVCVPVCSLYIHVYEHSNDSISLFKRISVTFCLKRRILLFGYMTSQTK